MSKYCAKVGALVETVKKISQEIKNQSFSFQENKELLVPCSKGTPNSVCTFCNATKGNLYAIYASGVKTVEIKENENRKCQLVKYSFHTRIFPRLQTVLTIHGCMSYTEN